MITLQHRDELLECTVIRHQNGTFSCRTPKGFIDMRQCGINLQESALEIISEGKQRRLTFALWPGHLAIFPQNGVTAAAHEFDIWDPLADAVADEAGSDRIFAPMPGLVKQLSVHAGQEVSKGDALIVLEAMKMEHTLAAPRDGVMAEILVSEGDQVDDGALLAALQEEA